MHILMTGGTGTIGRRLVQHLTLHGHRVTVLSRQPYKPATLPAKIRFAPWDGKSVAGWGHFIEEIDAIVNLAGAGLAEARWSPARKKLIVDSRAGAGQALVEAIRAANNKPKVLVQSSAVGFYGTGNTAITESAGPGDDFLAEVCKQWEASTEGVEEMGVRRVVIRTGVVLDTAGGAFPKLVMPFRFFAGGPVGSGRQWVSWIHHLDAVGAIRFLIENESVAGAVNLTAPNPAQNRTLAKTIGKTLKRPSFFLMPGFVLKIIFGEMSTVLLDGQQVLPGRLDGCGYQFKFPTAQQAIQDLLG
jgi:hypothetical protein